MPPLLSPAKPPTITPSGAVTLPCAALLVMLPLFSPTRPPTFSLPETLTAAVHLSTALATENMVS